MKLKPLNQQTIVITCGDRSFRDQLKWSHADNLHHAGHDGNVRGEWSDRTRAPASTRGLR